MSYGDYGDLTPSRAGLLVGLHSDIEGRVAKDAFAWGAPVFYDAADEKGAYAPVQDVVTVLLDADLVASNVLTTTVTLNGVALAAQASTYATSHAATMTAHIALIEALTGVTCIAGSTNRAFVVTGTGDVNVSVTSVVTLGASQAGVTKTYSTSSLVFAGVAPVSHREFWDGATQTSTTGQYPVGDMVNILALGEIVVRVPNAEANTANKKAYVIANSDSADFGKFTSTSTNNYDCGCYFKSNPENYLAEIEVRGIK